MKRTSRIRPVQHWEDGTINHEARERAKFRLYSFNEICRMSPEEWEEECRRNGCDFDDTNMEESELKT
jgi:hypothetical protein